MLSNKYSKNADGIWATDNDERFVYSDGEEVENRLIALLQQAKDVSVASDELQYFISDWPSEYHFSPLRANLLTSFDLGKLGSILEVGSGCGALTRSLGESHPKTGVIALEGSARRAEITRTRCRDLQNVEVCCDSFASFESDDLFGSVTMIGVLEYSPSYFAGEDPVLEALQRAQKLLHRNGVLVVAIENQLGLKYFNGCTEDHSGRIFTGIHDAYEPGTFRTFGRKHLFEKMFAAGFENVEFVYPFPDYKLPRLLLREGAFNHDGFDVPGLVGQYPSRDYTGNSQRLFQEIRAWDVLYKNDVMADLANSFLAFGFNGRVGIDTITKPWLAKAYSCPRKKRYLSETVFSKDESGMVTTKKRSFSRQECSLSADELIDHSPVGGEYIEGIPYSSNFSKQVSGENSFVKIIEYLRPWVTFFSGLISNECDSGELNGIFLDCLPSNIIIDRENRLTLFDQEWEYKRNIKPGFILFRGVYRELSVHMDYLTRDTDLFGRNSRFENAYDVLSEIFAEFGYFIDKSVLDTYITLEVNIQKALIVYKEDKEDLYCVFSQFFLQSRISTAEMEGLLFSKKAESCSGLQYAKDVGQKQVAQDLLELASIKSGWSWKLGRMITFIPRRIKVFFAI